MLKRKQTEVLGLDFDGVCRRWPGYIEWFADFLSPTDVLQRAHLDWIEGIICHLAMDFIPTILDGDLIRAANTWNGKIVIVTGRYKKKQKLPVIQIFKYLKASKIVFRPSKHISEEQFKYDAIKREGISVYIEDRKYVVNFLHSKGIEVHHIREIRKPC